MKEIEPRGSLPGGGYVSNNGQELQLQYERERQLKTEQDKLRAIHEKERREIFHNEISSITEPYALAIVNKAVDLTDMHNDPEIELAAKVFEMSPTEQEIVLPQPETLFNRLFRRKETKKSKILTTEYTALWTYDDDNFYHFFLDYSWDKIRDYRFSRMTMSGADSRGSLLLQLEADDNHIQSVKLELGKISFDPDSSEYTFPEILNKFQRNSSDPMLAENLQEILTSFVLPVNWEQTIELHLSLGNYLQLSSKNSAQHLANYSDCPISYRYQDSDGNFQSTEKETPIEARQFLHILSTVLALIPSSDPLIIEELNDNLYRSATTNTQPSPDKSEGTPTKPLNTP